LRPKLEAIELQRAIKEEIIQHGECYNKKMMAITGKDLLAYGIPKGQVIGSLLEDALNYVIEKPDKNEKAVLLEYCNKVYLRKY
jgi:tRNA nucleotidyltransferase (CCA-adding enzyme)